MLKIGDRFRVKDHPHIIYTVWGDYIFNGRRYILGHYRHALQQYIGCDMPEPVLEATTELMPYFQ